MTSLAERLLSRELGSCCGVALHKGWMRDAVCKLGVQEVFEDGVSSTAPAESWITQLLVTPTYVVTLTKTGRCMVYDKGTTQPVCCLNQYPHEHISTLFYAPRADALFVVANLGGLLGMYILRYSCRHLKAEAQTMSGVPLLGEENVTHHGFIEFEESSERALIYLPVAKVYRLYDLGSMRLMYRISSDHVQDVQMGPQFLVLHLSSDAGVDATPGPGRSAEHGAGSGSAKADDTVTLRVLAAPNGMVLQQQRLRLGSPLHQMQVARGRLVLQEADHTVHIYQLPSLAPLAVIPDPVLAPGTQLLPMAQQDLLVAVMGVDLCIWDMNGRRLPELDNHQLWYPEHDSCCLVESEGWVISYCGERDWDGMALPSALEQGLLHVSDLTSGRLLAQFGSKDEVEMAVLADVTAICFDPTECAIYTAYEKAFKWSWDLCASAAVEAGLDVWDTGRLCVAARLKPVLFTCSIHSVHSS